jgi:APA family basic amino acid/polyamine antiporter
LLRIFGVGFGLAAVIGGMVGQGILRSPGVVASTVPDPTMAMALWVFGAVVSVLSALAYVELGSAIPAAGGPFDYMRRAFGDRAAIVTGWAVFLAIATSTGMLAYVTGEFLVRLGASPSANPAVPALAVVALFFAVNWTGTRLSGVTQMLFSSLKGGALVAFVAVLFMQPGGSATTPAIAPAAAGGILGTALALRVIFGTYAGWQDIALYCEELEKPGRSLPRSLLGGIAMVGALYLLVNLALFHVLSPAQMAGSNLAAADAAAVVFGARGELALTFFGVLSVAAVTNLGIMSATRITYALGRAGILPDALATVAASGTPRVALSVIVGLIALLVATGTFDTLSVSSTSLYQLNVILVTVAAVALRRREPELPRPFRVPWFWPVVTLSLLVNSALMAAFVAEEPWGGALGFGLLAICAAASLGLRGNRPLREGEHAPAVGEA